MLAMQREQRALLELQRFEHAFAVFDQVEQQLGGPVQVQALPAAGQTGEAASAGGKKGGSKAITAEFQTLDVSRSREIAGSSNGHRPFRRHH